MPEHLNAATLRDRIRGSLLGAAIGDALGSAFEFVDSAEIERATGSNVATIYRTALPNSLLAPRRAGIATDDTAMTLALIEALADGDGFSPASVFAGIATRLRRGAGPVADMFWGGGPGGACVAMLHAADAGAAAFEQISPSAGGNGAAMRAHPCGAFADRAFVAETAAMQARLSHPHPAAVASAQVVAIVVHGAMYRDRLDAEFPSEIDEPQMLAAWERAHAAGRNAPGAAAGSTPRLPAALLDVDMAGWNTVAAAHAIAVTYRDVPVLALGLAAASGRDTDTVASIVGGMLGALHGTRMLPSHWLDGLEARDLVERAADTLFRTVAAENARRRAPS